MKTIKILGTGCPKCQQTEAMIREALVKLGVEADVQKVEDIQQIMEYSIMSTPAVVVDEVVKVKGHVPTFTELKQILV
ncbi:MAG: thioredoxin family protein [Cyclobacteriaceae bacterium]